MSVKFVGISSENISHHFLHEHNVWEIILNFAGNGYTDIAGMRYPFVPGTIFCMPPNKPHTKTAVGGFRDIYMQPVSFNLVGVTDENNVLVLQDDSAKSIEGLMFLALRVFHKKDEYRRDILDAICKTINKLILSWTQAKPQQTEVDRLRNQIIQSFTDPDFSLTTLLSESTHSADHVRRCFKQAYGCAPSEYLTELRINYAKRLISENEDLNYTLGEIGAMSGYFDNHYFSRVFKEKTGMTPSQCMQTWQKK